LQAFRVTIDYKNSAVYFEKQRELDSHDMDVVGLALARSRSGGYAIVSIVQKDGLPAVDEAQPGDKLLKVDDLDVTHADLQTVVDALRGKPGDQRTLVLDRKGKTVTTKARVMRLI
jgi:C-terminal processing protease CtpA/Prc